MKPEAEFTFWFWFPVVFALLSFWLYQPVWVQDHYVKNPMYIYESYSVGADGVRRTNLLHDVEIRPAIQRQPIYDWIKH